MCLSKWGFIKSAIWSIKESLVSGKIKRVEYRIASYKQPSDLFLLSIYKVIRLRSSLNGQPVLKI